MGETIQLLQLLPRALAVEHSGAAVVSCDIRKAYDTACRGFLQHSMAALGVGSGFRRVVGRLLSHTRARAFANGTLSEPATFSAGVRQGCPLAPLLYLFIGQALSCFLRARGIGILIDNQILSAAQFADDTTAFLRDLSLLPNFNTAMTCFGTASGQRLNPAKTNVLLMGDLDVGAVAGPSPATVAAENGMRLVSQMSVLGIPLAYSPQGLGQATNKWEPRLAEVARRSGKIASLPLSGFGRGFAASAYGLSTLLFNAEFCGLPPKTMLSRLQSQVAALVDHKRDPANQGPRRFHGISAVNQLGNPAVGGFGVLAVAEHVAARHAVWGLRLVEGLALPVADQKPWVTAARVTLPRECRVNPLALFAWRPTSRQLSQLPLPLRRMCEGIALLPSLQGLKVAPPGDWCAAAPLWHNPLLETLISGPPLAHQFPNLTCYPIYTIWMLMEAMRFLHAPTVEPNEPIWVRDLPLASRMDVWHKMDALWRAVPPSWTAACMQVREAHVPPSNAFMAVAWETLGWRTPTGEHLLANLTVRLGTELQLRPKMLPRRDKQLHFQRLALSIGAAAAPPAAATAPQPVMPALLSNLWRLGCGNIIKEPYWRLVLDALPTARRRGAETEQCCCGASSADREHHYWRCQLAQRMVTAMDDELMAFAARHGRVHTPLTAAEVWLCRPPVGVLPWLWQLVCMAAIAAMEFGRRGAARLQLSEPPTSAEAALIIMGRSAEARLWELLAEAASGHKLPTQQSGQQQPFLQFDSEKKAWRPRRAA